VGRAPKWSEAGWEVILYADLAIAVLSVGALTLHGVPWPWATAAGVGTLTLLLLMLLDRRTVWVAAFLGSALASAYCGVLGWAFGFHVVGAALGGLIGFAFAASAYVPLLRRSSTGSG
jgi:hypothetical protein